MLWSLPSLLQLHPCPLPRLLSHSSLLHPAGQPPTMKASNSRPCFPTMAAYRRSNWFICQTPAARKGDVKGKWAARAQSARDKRWLSAAIFAPTQRYCKRPPPSLLPITQTSRGVDGWVYWGMKGEGRGSALLPREGGDRQWAPGDSTSV